MKHIIFWAIGLLIGLFSKQISQFEPLLEVNHTIWLCTGMLIMTIATLTNK